MNGNYLILLCLVSCSIFQPSSSGGGGTVLDLNIVSINSTAILVTWSGPMVSNIASYSATAVSSIRATSTTIQITTNIGTYPNYVDQNVTFTGLFPYTDYDISIDGTIGLMESLDTLTQTHRTDEAVSAAPNLITVSVENATTINVTWSVPMELEQNGPIEGFIIDFSNNEIPEPYNRSYDIMGIFPIPSGTNYTVMFRVEEGITYIVSVVAVNGAGMSPSSTSLSVSTPVVDPPNAVPFNASEIVVVSETPTTINFSVPTVSIVFLNGPLVGYTIEYVGSLLSSALFELTNSPNSTLDTTSVLSVDVSAGSGIVIADLQPNYLYTWNISVRNGLGSTLPQTITRKSPSALPSGAPINIALTVVSQQQINVSWSINLTTVNGQLRSFNVNYSAPGYSNSVVYSPINSTGPYQLSLTGLTANTLHSVRVSIVNSVGEGMQSSSVTAQTLAIPSIDTHTQSSSTTVQVSYIPTRDLASRHICLVCILIPILTLIIIGIILIIVVIAFIFYLLWNSRQKNQTSIEVAPKREKVRPQSSIALVEHESKDTIDV